MDQKTMTIKCIRCGKQYLLMEMVMDASGKGMACRSCAGLPPKGQVKAPEVRRSQAREMFSKPTSPKSSSGKYACSNCKYRFSSSKPLSEISCPYCGSRRVSTPAENSADALLQSAGSREYDF